MLNPNKIFLDFDGTLNNCSHRLYFLFKKLVTECSLSNDEYWKIKKNGKTQSDFLKDYFNYSESEIIFFKKEWMKNIENIDLLTLDEPYPNSEKFLKKLSLSSKLYLVSARQSKERLLSQVGQYSWEKYFEDIISTEQRIKKSISIKLLHTYDSNDLFIGDSLEDIEASKEMNIKSILINTNNYNSLVINACKPNFIINNLNELINLF